MKSLSYVRLFATPWTVAYQAPSFMEFSRQEYWSGLPFPPPGDLPNLGIEPASPMAPELAGFPCGSAGKESACNVGDLGSIPRLGRSPGKGKGYSLQYSGLGSKESDTTERLSLRFQSGERKTL